MVKLVTPLLFLFLCSWLPFSLYIYIYIYCHIWLCSIHTSPTITCTYTPTLTRSLTAVAAPLEAYGNGPQFCLYRDRPVVRIGALSEARGGKE